MPVTDLYFEDKKSGGNVSARCTLYRGNNDGDIKQFDSFETVVKKLNERLKKISKKIDNLKNTQ